jgi:hypothetical protein
MSLSLLDTLPFDTLMDVFGPLSIGDVEKYCEVSPVAAKSFHKETFTTRVSIDFVVWVVDEYGDAEIEASESIIVRIKWKCISELTAKIKAISTNVLGKKMPFSYNDYDQEPVDDCALKIDEQTRFSDLFDKIWTIHTFEKVVFLENVNDSINYNAEDELVKVRKKYRTDFEWPAIEEKFSTKYILQKKLGRQFQTLINNDSMNTKSIVKYMKVPNTLVTKIRRESHIQDELYKQDKQKYYEEGMFF